MVERNTHLGDIELTNNRPYQGPVDFELAFEVHKGYTVKVSARSADDQFETEKALKPSPSLEKVVDRKLMSKDSVNNAIRNALLDWQMYEEDINARMRKKKLNR